MSFKFEALKSEVTSLNYSQSLSIKNCNVDYATPPLVEYMVNSLSKSNEKVQLLRSQDELLSKESEVNK